MIMFKRCRRGCHRAILTMLAAVVWIIPGIGLWANPTTARQAESAVQSWLARAPRPLGAELGTRIRGTRSVRDRQGVLIYYVVSLDPGGYVIAAADDLAEPIVAFFARGAYDPAAANPLVVLAGGDLAGRVAEARGKVAAAAKAGKPFVPEGAQAAARKKWIGLTDAKALTAGVNEGLVSDVRVAPLIQSRWDQTTAGGAACYNYYTPPYAAGSAANYPAGCVATVMAQLMRFHQWPAGNLGTFSFTIKVDGTDQTRMLRGGDGSGGAYDYAMMPLAPDGASTDAQRRAIGALVHDSGAAVSMEYTAAGSAASLQSTRLRLIDTFKYSNAIYAYNYDWTTKTFLAIAPADLERIINPNLDAGFPVILGINNRATFAVGHAIACDGYGYHAATVYHHVNMGWSGASDGWYNLPDIGTSRNYDLIFECLYNIFKSGQGELVSGRVLDGAGAPLAGAAVTATRSAGAPLSAVTDANGIYAFKSVPANTRLTVSVQAASYEFPQARTATTGKSSNYNPASGNVWGVDFQAEPDAWPRVQFGAAASSFREDAGTVAVEVTLNGPATDLAQVDYAITSGTATGGTDFQLSRTGSIFIQPGQSRATLALRLVDDGVGEPPETIQLTLSPQSSCLPGKTLTHTLTIMDNDDYLGEALDNTQLKWRSGGDAAWFGQTAKSRDGVDAAQSGAVEPGQSTTLYTYVTGPGTLGFGWAAATQAGDRLTLTDLATTTVLAGGAGAFQQQSVTIGAGVRLLKWTLARPAASPAGLSTAWLDQVTWNGGVPAAGVLAPYSGTAATIPGRIEAEDFDLGGNATAYFDSTPGNAGGVFRTGEDVDLAACPDQGGGTCVTNVAPEEWLGYTINATTTATCTIRLRVASAGGGRCRLERDGAWLSDPIDLPPTGGLQAYQTVEVPGIPIKAGSGVLRFHAESGGFNLNYLEIEADTGSLRVELTPAPPEAAWRRVGTTLWRASGDTETGVPIGTWLIEFKDVPNWIKPTTMSVEIGRAELTDIYPGYVRQTGAVRVTIIPEAAVAGGARWRPAGSATWLESGDTTTGIGVGPCALEFKDVAGWRKPAGQVLNVLEGVTNEAAGTYVAVGALKVTLSPPEANAAGAAWRRVGTTAWIAGGAGETDVEVGTHLVEFKDVTGWKKPAPAEVTVNAGQTTILSRSYSDARSGVDWSDWAQFE